MKWDFPRFITIVFFLLLQMGCGQRTHETVDKTSSTFSTFAAGENVLRIDVGTVCAGYINEPCVSLTVCEPGTNNCQEIPRVLLDTGSYGLRIFSEALHLRLPTKSIATGDLAQCVGYLDGTSHWGPVKTADLKMAEQKAFHVPIQVIDSSYVPIPADCTNLESDPAEAGYNGILGIGNLVEDCGPTCATTEDNRIYFACREGVCNATAVSLRDQVTNPIVSLEKDNNGVIIQLPSIPSTGAQAAIGSLILGIGTRDNNRFSNIQNLSADSLGNFRTRFNSVTYTSAFLDTGSNGLFFPRVTALPDCFSNSELYGFYCPASATEFTAIQIGSTGSPEVEVPFQVANASLITSSGDLWAFNNLGGVYGGGFDWGLPFFFGRTVHIGIENRSSPLGIGPYWGF